MNKKAFTLIELIIVIAIIAILAALSFVAVNPGKRIGQAQDDERLTEAINKYTADNLSLPPSIASLEDYIPYMITNLGIPDLLDCPEVLGNIPIVNISNELIEYLPVLPIDPQEEDPDNNGTGII